MDVENGEIGNWRRSSRCEAGACLEVLLNDVEAVQVRDGKDRAGPWLTFSNGAWRAFLRQPGRGFPLTGEPSGR